MRKLYTDVSLETPFMVSYNDAQTQACANDEDTITIGGAEYIRLTDEYGHNVSDEEGNQLLLNDGVIYKVVSGVPESTNVQVTDVSPEPIPTQYTLTISPTPADAEVTLTATGFTQVGNSIAVDDGTTVSYSVSKTGYITSTGTYTINGANYTLSVTLEEEQQPSETFWHLTDNPNEIIIDEPDAAGMYENYAMFQLWNSTASEAGRDPSAELRATSDTDTSGEGYQVGVDTDEGGVVETDIDGETAYMTPLLVQDVGGTSEYYKVTMKDYNTDMALYLRLAEYRVGDTYDYPLYGSYDGINFEEVSLPSGTITITIEELPSSDEEEPDPGGDSAEGS